MTLPYPLPKNKNIRPDNGPDAKLYAKRLDYLDSPAPMISFRLVGSLRP